MADSELDRLLAQYAQPPPPTLTGGAPPLPSINLTQQEPPLAQHNLVHRGLSSFGQPALDATEGALRGEVSPRDLAWTYLTEGPLGPFGMARGPTRIPDPIRAYHGSPHTFDEFRMDRIGTGEGAQAYGHGLYFAESPGVATTYRAPVERFYEGERLLTGAEENAGRALSAYGTREGAKKFIQDLLDRPTALNDTDYLNATLAAIDRIDMAQFRGRTEPGRMYEVNLHARPEQFLDWDVPLSGQSEVARQGLDTATGGWVTRNINHLGAPDKPIHHWLHMPQGQMPNASGTTERFAQSLSEAGIPGIRYLDQGSRGAGEGTRNFVVFNPEIIEILRRYGMAGPVAGGVLGGALGGTDGPE
jgi:hypothetical protein